MDGNDLAQLTQIKQGDSQAMADFYDRHSRIVYSVALRVLRCPASAEDILQEVFMMIWRRPESCLPAKAEVTGWLAVVARNRSIDLLQKRRPLDSIEDIDIPSRYSIANDAEHNMLCERAKLLIRSLPPEQERAMSMAYFDGMTHAEISETTKCPLGTIKSRVRSGLSSLRKVLADTKPAPSSVSVPYAEVAYSSFLPTEVL